MTDVVPLKALVAEFGLHAVTTEKVLSRAKIKPLFTIPYGRGVAKMYDRTTAREALEKYVEANKAPPPPPPPAAQTAVPAAHPDYRGLTLTIEVLLEEMRAAQLASVERDRQTWKAINDMLKAVNELVVAAKSPTAAPALPSLTENDRAPVPIPPPPASRKRVVIVGLINSQVTEIDKEFGEAFDITHIAADEIKSRGKGYHQRLQAADVVISMVRFVPHSAEDMFRGAGVTPIRVQGTLSALREFLTRLFVEGDE